MIGCHPFRILSSLKEVPLSIPTDLAPGNSELNLDDDFTLCDFNDHREFIRLVRKAELDAKRNGVKGNYHWREYRGFVGPNCPPITKQELKIRLMSALQRIPNISNPEKKVKKNYILFLINSFQYLEKWKLERKTLSQPTKSVATFKLRTTPTPRLITPARAMTQNESTASRTSAATSAPTSAPTSPPTSAPTSTPTSASETVVQITASVSPSTTAVAGTSVSSRAATSRTSSSTSGKTSVSSSSSSSSSKYIEILFF